MTSSPGWCWAPHTPPPHQPPAPGSPGGTRRYRAASAGPRLWKWNVILEQTQKMYDLTHWPTTLTKLDIVRLIIVYKDMKLFWWYLPQQQDWEMSPLICWPAVTRVTDTSGTGRMSDHWGLIHSFIETKFDLVNSPNMWRESEEVWFSGVTSCTGLPSLKG